jgi:hypothetical protein
MLPIVKPMINGRVLAFGVILSIAFAILSFVLSSLVVSSAFGLGPQSPGILFQSLFLALGVVSVLLAIWCTWGAWFWLRLERRRQAAAWRSPAHNFLAAEQPALHTGELALPLTISLRARWPMKLIVWPCVPLFAIIAAANAAPDHVIWDLRVFFALLGALGAGSGLALLLTGERQLEVTHDHLTLRVGGTKYTVPWEEAWLFAITRGRRATLSYELASSEASVPWAWVRPGTFSAYLFEPTIPQYEYDYQMEALLGLIAARTDLPLCDLR